ncbi:unnamed protein product [Ilex paraguariensis]|uniref:AAA+ ATPase domain-containing protein n=1 Tax=Ilex paraguariensis TaxID=185542 RepID=A0ABC8REP3_9AQUA
MPKFIFLTLITSIEKNEEIADTFQNVQLKWRFVCSQPQSRENQSTTPEKKLFELTFDKKFKEKVLNDYLPHVLEEYQNIKDSDKVLNLSDGGMNIPGGKSWGSIKFEHPSTFGTLAMNEEAKAAIIDDLDRLVSGKDVYKRAGRAWKRGYLLYGPPGTGKSSLVASMANYLGAETTDRQLSDRKYPYFNDYDNKDSDKVLNLSDGGMNIPGGKSWGSIKFEHPSTFGTLAMNEEAKAAIIDDLDRFVSGKDVYKRAGRAWKRGYLLYGPPGTGKSSLVASMANYLGAETTDRQLSDRKYPYFNDYDNKFTLSGLLNFIDGLWSSCGDGRIIIFTTNHIDRLDPALLRSGRMDMHIPMSYCTPEGFRLLASKYLTNCNNHHRLFGEIEGLIENVEATPAEKAGELIKTDNPDVALVEVVNFLKRKQIEAHDTKGAKRIKTEKIGSRIKRNCRKRSAVS